ncbi:FecR domain-containing protein [Paenibacillus sp. 32352]|uniref:FecR domain-containing protein n=1 Tax=Paenibacillus sp. 32352 TaxID=1969111 RepID=UPI0009AD9B4E|nr:FecR domain-containing protein [Paenibacillus sp. 32352]
MKFDKRIGVHNGNRFIAMFVIGCMFIFMLSSVWVPSVDAKSTRAAIVTEVIGDVSVRKAGGSKTFTAYTEMTLNQGDFITTGSNSSLTLKIADRDDEITLGDNTEISITELIDSGNGKTSKFKMWAGSAWAKVKSLVSSQDEYEIETPTAVMGVRGTHFLTMVDPITGQTTMVTTAGVVHAETHNADSIGSGPVSRSVNVYPSQQISLDSRDPSIDLRTQTNYADFGGIIHQASPKVLETIIRDYPDIAKENEELKQRLLNNFQSGIQKPDGSILKLQSLEDLNRVTANFDAFIPALAKAAVDAGKLNQAVIDRVNEQLKDMSKKIDLNAPPVLDTSAGIDPDIQALKQSQQEKPGRFTEEYAKLQELIQMYKDAINAIRIENGQLADANRKLMDEANELARLQLNRANNDGSSTNPGSGGTAVGGGSSGSGRPSGGIRPAQPELVSPTTGITTFNPAVLRWKAPVGQTVSVYHGSELLGTVEGRGSEEVTMTLGVLPEGTYRLTAESVRNGIPSVSLSLPPITISEMPILISPTADWITNVPVVAAKGPIQTKLKILNQGQVIAEADGQGDREVTIPLNSLVTDQLKVYDQLTLVGERNGKQTKPVPLPKITTDGSMGVLLKSAVKQNNTVTATLAMKNFVNAKALYAAEVHLAYDNRLSYSGDGTVTKNPNTVFGSLPQSVEVLKQSKGTGQSELIYAATNFGTDADAGLITVDGEKLLAAIPLTLSGTDTNGLKVKLLYYKVVDKNGNVIAEVNLQNNPVEIPVN